MLDGRAMYGPWAHDPCQVLAKEHDKGLKDLELVQSAVPSVAYFVVGTGMLSGCGSARVAALSFITI